MDNVNDSTKVLIDEVFTPGNDTLFKMRHKVVDITQEEYLQIKTAQNVTVIQDNDQEDK